MNLNELAINITQLEGKKKQVNIGQVKEIISALGIIFAKMNVYSFFKLAWHIRQNGQDKLTCCDNNCECKE